MQSVSSKIWTRVTVSISCDDNHYTMGTSIPVINLKLNDTYNLDFWDEKFYLFILTYYLFYYLQFFHNSFNTVSSGHLNSSKYSSWF